MHDDIGKSQQPIAGDSALVAQFVGPRHEYYTTRFVAMQRHGLRNGGFNISAACAGPLWAAYRGVWWLFWVGVVLDLAGVILIVNGLVAETARKELTGWGLWAGVLSLIASAIALGFLANASLYRHYNRWRADRSLNRGVSAARAAWGVSILLAVLPLVAYRTTRIAPSARDCRNAWTNVGEAIPAGQQFLDCMLIGPVPTDLKLFTSVAEQINGFITYCTVNFQQFFDGVAWTIRTVLTSIETLLVGIPWPVTTMLLVLAAWQAAGRGVAIFVFLALAYLGLFNFWANAMSTLSLVFAAVLIGALVGVPIGIFCAKSARAYRLVRPVLDVMQTLPAFVYLIPAIAFFSVGKTPGVIATFIFSSPAAIRLTTLGIQQVPHSVKEAALAFGASPLQLLYKVELPLALPSIMTGINQTIMLSISMSVTAALIGAGGLGFDVLFALQNVEAGRGVLAGIAIALCAMMIDRIIQGTRRMQRE